MKKSYFLLIAIAFFAFATTGIAQPITSFPWAEGFENSGSIPTGWVNEITDDAEWEFVTEVGWFEPNKITADHTSGSGYFATLDADQGQVGLLTSPELDLTSLTNPQLVFWRHFPRKGGYSTVFEVNIFANGTWNNDVISDLTAETTDWSEAILDLTPYIYDDVKIQFRMVYDYCVYSIDDILVQEAPSCTKPTNLTAIVKTATTVELAWKENGSATEWTIEYGSAGFAKGWGTTVEEYYRKSIFINRY